MALARLRRPENAEGDFFVDSTCIDCDLCRQIAPESFCRIGEQSIVYRQPATPEAEHAAMKALITCPTASIGTRGVHSARNAIEAYPELIDGTVYFCGFASEASYGAASYLIVRPEGNVLVDSPRFARPLGRRIASLGGVSLLFLTHRDDVADHEAWSKEFGAERIMHQRDLDRHSQAIERVLSGDDAVPVATDLLAIPTPGHTEGHMVLLCRNRYLFSGDHLRWSPSDATLSASRDVCWFSWQDQIRSMQRLLQYRFEWVLPGHGRRVHLSAEEMNKLLHHCILGMQGNDKREW